MRLVRNKSRFAALSALFLLVGLTAWNHTRAKSEARLKSRADETWVEVLGDEEEELLEDATGAEKAVKTLIGNAATGLGAAEEAVQSEVADWGTKLAKEAAMLGETKAGEDANLVPLDKVDEAAAEAEGAAAPDEGDNQPQEPEAAATPLVEPADAGASPREAFPNQAPLKCANGADSSHVVYWKRLQHDVERVDRKSLLIPADAPRRYVSFEYDEGGWNNIRMAMEIALVYALSTGRTLVVPPKNHLYLLNKNGRKYGFNDFVDVAHAKKDHLDMVSAEEYMKSLNGPGGMLRGQSNDMDYSTWREQMRKVGYQVTWGPDKNIIAFAKDFHSPVATSQSPERTAAMDTFASRSDNGKRATIDAVTDSEIANASLVHFVADPGRQIRWLAHFYNVQWWADPAEERFAKRFVRDSLHYVPEVFCIAAKIVAALKKRSKGGSYCALHVRRGDFQFELTRVDAQKIIDHTQELLPAKGCHTLYIATDDPPTGSDTAREYFAHFTRAGYDAVFLADFAKEAGIDGMSSHDRLGMVEQVVAANGDVFIGTYWSTFTGYIMRMRGYLGKNSQSFYLPLTSQDDYSHAMQDAVGGGRAACWRLR